MKKVSRLILLLLIVSEGALSSTSRLKEKNEAFVRISTDGKLPYDPSTIGFTILAFYNAVLGRLLKVTENFELEPGLLKLASWDFEKQCYVLVLNDGLRFHNGRPATARDLEFSLVRFFLTRKRADPAAALKAIQGTENLKPGMRYSSGMVRGIEIISDKELRVRLRSFTPAFLYRLTEGWMGLVPQEELKDDYVTWKTHPIGAGPYRVVEVDSKAGRARIQKVDSNRAGPDFFTWLSNPKDADVDIVAFTPVNPHPERLHPEIKQEYYGYTALFFNYRTALGSNPEFREAVSLAIDRTHLIAGIPHVAPLYEFLLPQFPGRLNIETSPNLIRAKALFAKIPPALLKPTLLAYSSHKSRTFSEYEKRYTDRLKTQLESIGFKIRYAVSHHMTFSEKDSEGVFRIDDRGSAYSDPLMTFRPYGRNGFLRQYYPKNHSELEDLLNRAEVAKSHDDYSSALQKLSRLVLADRYIIPLFQKRNAFWISVRVLTVGRQYGVNFDPIEVRLK